MLEAANFLYTVIGGLIAALIMLIKKAFVAGQLSSEYITKEQTDEKIDELKNELTQTFDEKLNNNDKVYNQKFNNIDSDLSRMSKKFIDIDLNLSKMNETLVKLDARDCERTKFEMQIKRSEKDSFDRICTLLFELDKKHDALLKTVSEHNGVIKKMSFTE